MGAMSSPDASPAPAKHRELGLTDTEFELICAGMGREPNDVELAMFSLLWSEHCAYKHSKKLLRRLPTEGPRVVMGPGENAGAVDIGSGWSVAFKVESHNHPSAVEPFQGAATGVGGILRDVFALGARPIAVLDSLRFGELECERSRGSCSSTSSPGSATTATRSGCRRSAARSTSRLPTSRTASSTRCASGSPRPTTMVRAAAAGVGNEIVLMGATTGRDGIGGASVLASAELEEGDEKRPTVQIGDPFEEKKVMECCLELLGADLLVSLQDLGAAGLTSSAGEMAAAGEVGLDLDVDKVPKRNPDLEPFEVMVSESQERMLAVVEPGKVDAVLAICEKWETNGTVIGEVTEGDRIRIFDGDEQVGDMPVGLLVDDCPLYDLEPAEPGEWIYGNARTARPSSDPDEILLALLAAPVDRLQALGLRAVRPDRPVADRAPARAGRRRGAPDRRDRHRDRGLDRRQRPAGRLRSLRGHRRGACSSAPPTSPASAAEPLGLTNCLNFGNPEKPTVAWQLDRSTQALADACEALGVPVVGGNVSLYNETDRGPIYPTPVVGMVGELPGPRQDDERRPRRRAT